MEKKGANISDPHKRVFAVDDDDDDDDSGDGDAVAVQIEFNIESLLLCGYWEVCSDFHLINNFRCMRISHIYFSWILTAIYIHLEMHRN